MNPNCLLFTLLVIFGVQALAQDNSAFITPSGEPGYGVGHSVHQTSDGGYIITGSKYSSEPSLHSQMVWLIKTDPEGNKVWDRIFGGPRNDIGYSVQQTKDGGYIIVGSTESFGAGSSDAWLIKTDANGKEIWNRTFGGARADWGRSIQLTNDGGYIIAGSKYSYNVAHLSQMVWLIKTDAIGNEIWDRVFGGPHDDWGNSVRLTNDGGYSITGATKSYGESGKSALWLIKTDANGIEAWDRSFSGPGDTVGYSAQQTTDGRYIIAGSRAPYGTTTGEIWLIGTDSDGTEIWDRTFGGSEDDAGESVQETDDGGYIIIGSRPSSTGGGQDVWLIKTDANGVKTWDRTFDGSGWSEGKSVQQTGDGGYIITGSKFPYGGWAKNSALWLIKTDNRGNKIWDRIFS